MGAKYVFLIEIDTVETHKSCDKFVTNRYKKRPKNCNDLKFRNDLESSFRKSSFFQKITCSVLHRKGEKRLKWLQNAITVQNKSGC